jgi:hypothetical protein
MKITIAEKKVAPVNITTLSVGEVFYLSNEIQQRLDKKERNYYMVTTRNGHREYCSLKSGAIVSFNTDCSVIKVDCALIIYDTIE